MPGGYTIRADYKADGETHQSAWPMITASIATAGSSIEFERYYLDENDEEVAMSRDDDTWYVESLTIDLQTSVQTCADAGGEEDWLQDGYCDEENNISNCEWDGGDCCQSTCVGGDYDCGANGYDCQDPAGE